VAVWKNTKHWSTHTCSLVWSGHGSAPSEKSSHNTTAYAQQSLAWVNTDDCKVSGAHLIQKDNMEKEILKTIYCLLYYSSQTRKAQLTQRGTHDSDACVNARCKWNLKFTMMFHSDSTANDTKRYIQCMNFSIAHHVQCMNSNIGWKSQIFPTPLIKVTPFKCMEKLYWSWN